MRSINSDDDYEKALSEIERLVALDPPRGTRDAARLEFLATLIERYERKAYSFE
ncbi:MAG: hypothetical protein R3322_00200 [Kiloniellales bacterium]|nr:hypothetical protein [Kiloniellales bacterium]